MEAVRAADGRWVATLDAADGDAYWLVVDDGPPLVDPHAWDVALTADGPRSVFRAPWPAHPQAAPLAAAPVVYELHVKGFGGGYLGCIDRLDHVASTGATVIELLPVHPFEDDVNYWGYMPLVWGAVHRGYAAQPERAAEELTQLVAAAHQRGLHVWLDVVFNHTGDDGLQHPVRTLRGLDASGPTGGPRRGRVPLRPSLAAHPRRWRPGGPDHGVGCPPRGGPRGRAVGPRRLSGGPWLAVADVVAVERPLPRRRARVPAW